MISKTKLLAAALAVSFAGAATGCESREGVDRWATTDNTNVQLDWDKVNEAYKLADGPEDLEKRINEIYEGDEIISIAVQDQDDKTQIVTGFFDKNTDGKVEDAEKIFTIKRQPTGEGAAQYQTQGYGAYYGYHSPMMGIATGMLMGHMMSSMFMPSYVPVYSRPYVTPSQRVSSLQNHRSGYRAQNPERFGPRSKSGRSYGGKPSTSRPSYRPSGGGGGGGRRGGGFFGLARAGRTVRPERLTA